MPLLTEKNKPIRVSLTDGNGDFLDLGLLVNKIPFNEYFRERFPNVVIEPIFEFTVPLGQELRIQGIVVSGTSSFEWNLRKNSIDVHGGYLSAATPAIPVDFADGYIVFENGDELELFIFHNEITQQTFQGNLFGYFPPIIT